MSEEIYMTIDQREDGSLQLSIEGDDGGYRIAGPKYAGTSKPLLRHELTRKDVQEIRSYLRRVL
jgi:hypothetical protein